MKNNQQLVGALLNDINANLIGSALNMQKEVKPEIIGYFLKDENSNDLLPLEAAGNMISSSLYTISQLIPDADLDQIEFAESTINGYQGMLMDDKPVFPNLEYLREVLEESGSMIFLEKHFKN